MSSRSIAILKCLVCFSLFTYGLDRKVKVTGLFSDMHYVEGAGDVIGTEILISFSTNGYWVYVQMAEGVPGNPALVNATVTDDKIEFVLPESMGGRFTGHVTDKGLVGKFERFCNKNTTLPPRKSYWQ